MAERKISCDCNKEDKVMFSYGDIVMYGKKIPGSWR